MQLVSYKQFSKLRLRDFLPIDREPTREDKGFECALGDSGCEMNVGVFFAWPVDHPNEVGEIDLYFREGVKGDCSPELAQKIMDAVGFPCRPKMKKDEVFAHLGTSTDSRDWPTGLTSFDFKCDGENEASYNVCCYIHPEAGLCSVSIVRSDFLLEAE